jgi:hypothetical protein
VTAVFSFVHLTDKRQAARGANKWRQRRPLFVLERLAYYMASVDLPTAPAPTARTPATAPPAITCEQPDDEEQNDRAYGGIYD